MKNDHKMEIIAAGVQSLSFYMAIKFSGSEQGPNGEQLNVLN